MRMGNHSQNHHNLTRLEDETFQQEIEPCFATIAQTYRDAGVEKSTQLFRPPGGGMDRAVMNYLWQRGIKLAWWSNNVGDWARPPAWKILNTVTPHLRPGDIILLHDAPGGYGTPQAIPAIVRAARKQNLEFVPYARMREKKKENIAASTCREQETLQHNLFSMQK